MAVIKLNAQEPNSRGITPVYYSVSSTPALIDGGLPTIGDQYEVSNNGHTLLIVRNGATATSLAIETPVSVDGLKLPDRYIPLASNSEIIIRPESIEAYGNPFKFAILNTATVSIAVITTN